MAKESVQFSLGLDGGPFVAGLRSALGQVTGGLGKQIQGALGKAFAIAAPVALVGRGLSMLKQHVDAVNSVSEKLGVSTDFVQGFQEAATQNNATVEQSSKALEKLSRKLGDAIAGEDQAKKLFKDLGVEIRNSHGEARGLESVLYDLSDRLKTIPSAAERTRVAFDLMGASGAAMIPTLQSGAKELRNMVDSANKLSTEELRRFDAIIDKVELVSKRAVVNAAKGISAVGPTNIARMIHELVEPGTARSIARGNRVEEIRQLIELQKERERQRMSEFVKAGKEKTARRELVDLEIIRQDAARKVLAVEELITRQKQAQTRIGLLTATNDADRSRAGLFTLEQLATLERPAGGFTRQQVRNIEAARRAIELMNQAGYAAANNDLATRDARINESLSITRNLAPLLPEAKDPFGEVDKAIAQSNRELAEIRNALTQHGIVVRNSK